ncbi:MAG: DUF2062 domain-containing protein [Candidatus Rokubacteria bacterium]|nr:DUF2062 domain-containing protein [Candidatus Rokubacteria bacterium]
MLSWKGLKARLLAVLHLDDAPWKIALGLAVGVFISCTPFYGLHTVMAIAAAFLLRLNKASTVTGAWLNLPWFAPFLYGLSLKVGELILSGGRGLEAIRGRGLLELAALIRPLLSLDKFGEGFMASSKLLFLVSVPLLVGTTVVGLLAGALTYFLALQAVREVRRLANVSTRGASSPEGERG